MTYTFSGSQNDEDKRLKAFNEAVYHLLVSPDECGSVLPFIELRLQQCGLRQRYEPKDVFMAVYDELVRELRAGRDITDVSAAFKATTIGVLRRYRTHQ